MDDDSEESMLAEDLPQLVSFDPNQPNTSQSLIVNDDDEMDPEAHKSKSKLTKAYPSTIQEFDEVKST